MSNTYLWIDHELDQLYNRWHPRWRMFEPSAEFWRRLGTEKTADLQLAAYELGQHLHLFNIPIVAYQPSLLMGLEEAGVIDRSGSRASIIQIPFAYVGLPYAVGAILAHEMTHQQLAEQQLGYLKVSENERFTDLASIANGLGKLVLNGLSEQAQAFSVEDTLFGYISSDEKVYAYRRVCEQYNLSLEHMKSSLLKEVVHLLGKSL